MGFFETLGRTIGRLEKNVEEGESAEVVAICRACEERFFVECDVCSACGSDEIDLVE